MPNQPKTPVRTFRLATEVWDRFRQAARREGVTVSDLLRRLIEDYLRGDKK